MSEAPRRIASTRIMFTSRTTGASSADSFSSKMSAFAHCSSSPSITSTSPTADAISEITSARPLVSDS